MEVFTEARKQRCNSIIANNGPVQCMNPSRSATDMSELGKKRLVGPISFFWETSNVQVNDNMSCMTLCLKICFLFLLVCNKHLFQRSNGHLEHTNDGWITEWKYIMHEILFPSPEIIDLSSHCTRSHMTWMCSKMTFVIL